MVLLPVYESNNPSQVYSIGRGLSCSSAGRHCRVTTDSKFATSLRCPTRKMSSAATVTLRSRKTMMSLSWAAAGGVLCSYTNSVLFSEQQWGVGTWEGDLWREGMKVKFLQLGHAGAEWTHQCQECQRLCAAMEWCHLAGCSSHNLEVRAEFNKRNFYIIMGK